MNGVDILWFFEQQAQQNPDVTEEAALECGSHDAEGKSEVALLPTVALVTLSALS